MIRGGIYRDIKPEPKAILKSEPEHDETAPAIIIVHHISQFESLKVSTNLTFSIGFPRRTILTELILRIALSVWLNFSVFPSRQSNTGPYRPSRALGYTLSWDAILQESIFRN